MYHHPDSTQRGRQRRNSAIVGTVKAALRQNRLLFAYQPVVSAATGIIDYFECLLRIRDAAGNILPGAEFITAVEDFGLIGLIDRFVLERAVQELGTHPEVRLGFNVSGLTACDRPWLRALSSRLRNRPDLARRIIVEITETAALSDIEETARFVDTLRDAGCRVALDDFGAGHTSLRHLQSLAVDTVKIDGSFVRNLGDSSENRIFLRHLVGLTKGFWPEHDCRVRGEQRGRGPAARRGDRLSPRLSHRRAHNPTPVARDPSAGNRLNQTAMRRRIARHGRREPARSLAKLSGQSGCAGIRSGHAHWNAVRAPR